MFKHIENKCAFSCRHMFVQANLGVCSTTTMLVQTNIRLSQCFSRRMLVQTDVRLGKCLSVRLDECSTSFNINGMSFSFSGFLLSRATCSIIPVAAIEASMAIAALLSTECIKPIHIKTKTLTRRVEHFGTAKSPMVFTHWFPCQFQCMKHLLRGMLDDIL